MAITARSQRIARQRRPRRNPPQPGGAMVSVAPPVAPDAPPPSAPLAGAGLRLPHERDQSVDSQSGPAEPRLEQAWRDIESGQVDTDLRATPGLDAERRRRLVPGSR